MNLYNGNISRMATTLGSAEGSYAGSGISFTQAPQLNAYTYDQLQRIREMQVVSQGISANSWDEPGAAIDQYSTSYTYDANGNILSLQRNADTLAATGSSGLLMDDLTYSYETSNGHIIRNRLLRVDDAVVDGAFENDYDEPAPSGNTYTYDASGNLVKDLEAEIDTIIWTPSGKIQRITRESTSSKADLEFGYDAGGNRLWKKVIPDSGQAAYTYYLRDAQGNILATYTRTVQDSAPPTWSDHQGREIVELLSLTETHLYGSSRLGMVDEQEIRAALAYDGTAYDHENATNLLTLTLRCLPIRLVLPW
ncbi:MAG: hypothetical protein R3B47_08140 [Bacteroidia bacterium]